TIISILPGHLHPAYDWTDAFGELDELRLLTGDRLAEYCRESAASASENGEDDVTESDLLELAEWLRLDYVRSLTPSQAWDEYVGEQSTHEFVENCDGEPIEQAVERYLADMREQRTWLDWKSEEYAARLLVRHIEANRAA